MKRFFGIATDIDGTITCGDRRLSVEALKAAHMISGKLPIILVTGNTLCFSRTISKILGTRSPIIAENGGIFLPSYDAEPSVMTSHMNELRSALSLLLKNLPIQVFDSRERLTDVSFAKTVSEDEILPYLLNYPNIHLVDAEFAYHLTDRSICKGDALEMAARQMGKTAGDFAAIGDSDNDIDLFKSAGFSFAVANASDSVKREADVVLQNKYGDGFAEAVNYLLKNDMIELCSECRDFYL